jgi:hypothetical protein
MIFPPRVDVKSGRKMKTQTRAMHSPIKGSTKAGCSINVAFRLGKSLQREPLAGSLGKGPDVGHHSLDFVGFHARTVFGHFALPFFDDAS